MKNQLLLRIALGYLAFVAAQIGFWALLAPQSFFDGFPGMGRAWVASDGRYNEHLVRDFGALNLALLAITAYAAVKLTRELITVAALANLVWGVPHVLYHLFSSGDLPTGDAIASIGGLIALVAFAAALLTAARNPAFVKQPAS